MALENRDRARIIEILTEAFKTNLSVTYMIPDGPKKSRKIRGLMEYAVAVCEEQGKFVLSLDRNCCALVLFPHLNKTSVRRIFLDLKLAFQVVGIRRLWNVLRRESLIKKRHPIEPFYYLWFIGVDPRMAGNGLGSALLEQLTADAESMNLALYLETSTQQNIPWYQRFGFRIYDQLDLGYRLYFLKR
ncbi:GNAT family N-acetyltransferase [Pedobacter deserti]|uniref:GNAT family N-acetyltransferase n=1 Tax=Pedobacter deserti TaxID=2817382 RepID=UPI002108C91A|nr:GNAT family N-acetyltransferase [Pedobacter sp. SYSU D00382]